MLRDWDEFNFGDAVEKVFGFNIGGIIGIQNDKISGLQNRK